MRKVQIMHKYRILGKKGEGTFSEVLKCQHVKDGTYYACKKMKQRYDGVEQVNNLREIQAMRRLNPHTNIIGLHEIIYDKKTGTVALICELMDMNIYEMIRGRRHYLPEQKIKSYMYQLLKSIDHMHRCGIFHRDVKPENILVKDEVLKLADFGSCRSVYTKPPYTEYISTRWYRAPECLLTDGYYSYRMDLWSVGCVFFEVMSLHPLFPGSNEVDQIAKIHDVLGTPDASILNKMKHRNRGINFDFPPKKGTGIEKLIPHASQHCIELIYKMCTYDPDERITAKQALRHPYFRDFRQRSKVETQKSTSLVSNPLKNLKPKKSKFQNPSQNIKKELDKKKTTSQTPLVTEQQMNKKQNPTHESWRQAQIQKKRLRRQRRLAEQQQKSNQQLGNSFVVKNNHQPAGFGQGGGPKSVYSSSLPKVHNYKFSNNHSVVGNHLPRHQFAHHQPSSNMMLPGILKTNPILGPHGNKGHFHGNHANNHLHHKTKIKKEPKSLYGQHYQLPSINRQIYR